MLARAVFVQSLVEALRGLDPVRKNHRRLNLGKARNRQGGVRVR